MREIKYILGFRAEFTEGGATCYQRIDGKYTVVECEPRKGWFHGFFNDPDSEVVAVVEDVDGYCWRISPRQIKFVNNPSEAVVS